MQPDTLARTWTEAQHQVAEFEIEAAYARGFEAGQAAERADIRAAAGRLARSPFPPYLSPTAEKVVADLAERILAESRPLATPPPGDHPGGPVPAWGAES